MRENTNDALGLKRGTVALSPYNSSWPRLFAEERDRLAPILVDLVFPYEHVGSTAVPGLTAKPIIDFMGGVGSIDEARGLIPLIEPLGYEYRQNGDKPDRLLLVKGPTTCRTHHFSLVVRDSVEWCNYILFRDKLSTNPSLAEEYAELKESLARQFADDRPTYTARKAAFITKVLRPDRHADSNSQGGIA